VYSQTRDCFNRKSSPSSQNNLLFMSVRGFFKSSLLPTSKEDLAAAASNGDLNSLRQLIELKPSRVNKVLNDVT